MHPQKVASRVVKINGASAKTRIGTAYDSLKSTEIRLHCQIKAFYFIYRAFIKKSKLISNFFAFQIYIQSNVKR